MKTEEIIEIPLSTHKMLLSFFGSLAFVAIGIWFLVSPPKSSNPILGNPVVIFGAGLASILFFGFVVITILRKFKDKKPGLIISPEGITDNSSGVSAGLIPWTEIEEILVTQVMHQRFLMFMVTDPEKYINRVKNPLKRGIMKMNYKSYGSPVSISSNALNTNFEKLHVLLIRKMSEYKP